MSCKLFRPENRLTLENLLTPVSRVNRTCASPNLMAAYNPRRASRLAWATSGSVNASRIGLVVFVDQHGHPLPGALVQRFDDLAEADGGSGMARGETGAPLGGVQLRGHFVLQVLRVSVVAGAEVEPHDGMPHRPVPAVMDGQPRKQRLVALEQFLQRIHEQTLAEAPRAGKEVMLPSVHQPPGVGRLVHVVVAFLAEIPEGLDADGQLAFGRAGGARHRGATIPPCSPDGQKTGQPESEERSCSFPLPSLRSFDPSTSSGHRRLKAPQAQGPESGLEPAPDLIRGRGDPNQPTISSRAAPRPLTAGGRRTQHRGLRRLLRGHARRGVAPAAARDAPVRAASVSRRRRCRQSVGRRPRSGRVGLRTQAIS